MSGDGAYYYLAGNVLADGGGFVNPWTGIATAAHPPAWPALLGLPSLVGVDTVLGHQVFACLVGMATVVLVGLAARMIAGSRVGLIAAAIAAAYPNFWVRERELAAEALVFPLIAIVLALTYRYLSAPRRGTLVMLGAACGALVLAHASLVVVVVLLIPVVALRGPPGQPATRRLARLLATLGVAGLVLLPWVAHARGAPGACFAPSSRPRWSESSATGHSSSTRSRCSRTGRWCPWRSSGQFGCGGCPSRSHRCSCSSWRSSSSWRPPSEPSATERRPRCRSWCSPPSASTTSGLECAVAARGRPGTRRRPPRPRLR